MYRHAVHRQGIMSLTVCRFVCFNLPEVLQHPHIAVFFFLLLLDPFVSPWVLWWCWWSSIPPLWDVADHHVLRSCKPVIEDDIACVAINDRWFLDCHWCDITTHVLYLALFLCPVRPAHKHTCDCRSKSSSCRCLDAMETIHHVQREVRSLSHVCLFQFCFFPHISLRLTHSLTLSLSLTLSISLLRLSLYSYLPQSLNLFFYLSHRCESQFPDIMQTWSDSDEESEQWSESEEESEPSSESD